jgi:Transposase DDE domain
VSWTQATSALFEGGLSGPSQVDRARAGSKHHLLVDAAGVPLAVTLTAGNRNDITQLLPLVGGIMPVAERNGITAKRARCPLMS